MNQEKHPLQVRINDEREHLLSKFLEFKGTMPAEFEQVIEVHLNKLIAICDDLKDLTVDKCPEWFTEEVRATVKEMWNRKGQDDERYVARLDAAKMVMRIGEEAGFKVTLKGFADLREKYCL